ncbi:DUF1572 domain-containing protein [Flavobacteriaceae bacterium D16]|nr:DUF1572 domain-containing protein [Flavobacteriaceae bacterium D16]
MKLNMDLPTQYLSNIKKEFLRYKGVAEKSFEQLKEDDLHFVPNEGDNSIAVIVKHMVGNMRSRWTNFLTEDGEKSWRHRETEFEPSLRTKAEVLEAWNSGWALVLDVLNSLEPEQLRVQVKIRNEGHTVLEAINRQLAHYAYHTGQIVYLAKSIKGEEWESPSIPKGASDLFNKKMSEKASGNK